MIRNFPDIMKEQLKEEEVIRGQCLSEEVWLKVLLPTLQRVGREEATSWLVDQTRLGREKEVAFPGQLTLALSLHRCFSSRI
jgi:hypothetical protein